MVRMIFSDMDGTLLDDHGYVTDTNAQLIRDSGIPFTLVSARAPMEMAEAIDRLALKGPQIGFNGGLIYERAGSGWRVLDQAPMAKADAERIIAAVSARFPNVSLSYYTVTDWYAARIDEGLRGEIAVSHQAPTLADYRTVFAQEDLAVLKIMLISFDPAEFARLKAFFAEAQFPGVSAQQSGTAWFEITSLAAKKSRGIDYVLRREGIDAADAAAFGDGHNDLPMLNMVGTPIVMANALPEIKQVAKHLTAANTEDGVGHGIWRFLK
ncbi:HAD family hydrolase [Lacticaseibacillus daqingensis]|uniref:HAD family hydrolase n=1 Tax=Lacticaseibacillus daqingensis TaxID=2486014 RepID=UPI000F76A6A4|nr:HAD family hydrolase [Lacticaseibacillus daqingensis]